MFSEKSIKVRESEQDWVLIVKLSIGGSIVKTLEKSSTYWQQPDSYQKDDHSRPLSYPLIVFVCICKKTWDSCD